MKLKELLKRIFPVTIKKFQSVFKQLKLVQKSCEETKKTLDILNRKIEVVNKNYSKLLEVQTIIRTDLRDFKRSTEMNLNVQNVVIKQSVEVAKREEALLLALSEKVDSIINKND